MIVDFYRSHMRSFSKEPRETASVYFVLKKDGRSLRFAELPRR